MWLPLNLLRGLKGVGLPSRSDDRSDYNQARGERSQQQAAPLAARASILAGRHPGASLLSLKSRRPPVSSIQNLLSAIDISLQFLEGKDAGAPQVGVCESCICLQPAHTTGAWEPVAGLCRAWRAPVLHSCSALGRCCTPEREWRVKGRFPLLGKSSGPTASSSPVKQQKGTFP